jgi:hypothetical protein
VISQPEEKIRELITSTDLLKAGAADQLRDAAVEKHRSQGRAHRRPSRRRSGVMPFHILVTLVRPHRPNRRQVRADHEPRARIAEVRRRRLSDRSIERRRAGVPDITSAADA